MRTPPLPLLVLAAVILVATGGAARAEELSGSYDLEFEPLSHNCEHPIAFPKRAVVAIDVKGAEVHVDIDRIPKLTGKLAKNGKISAASRLGHTPIAGMDGTFSVAGRIGSDGLATLVMVGEYSASGKPLCTQTWNLSGMRASEPKPDRGDKADKPDKPKK